MPKTVGVRWVQKALVTKGFVPLPELQRTQAPRCGFESRYVFPS